MENLFSSFRGFHPPRTHSTLPEACKGEPGRERESGLDTLDKSCHRSALRGLQSCVSPFTLPEGFSVQSTHVSPFCVKSAVSNYVSVVPVCFVDLWRDQEQFSLHLWTDKLITVLALLSALLYSETTPRVTPTVQHVVSV